MQERRVSYQKDYAQFFSYQYDEKSSPAVDPSFVKFAIPSAKKLYRQTIGRSNFELLSKFSLEQIQGYLSVKGFDIDQLEIKTTHVSPSLYCHIFRFKSSGESVEHVFAAREKLIRKLRRLRYSTISKADLLLDSDTPLHFSNTEQYGFLHNTKVCIIPNSYRALCIYDLIVEELYLHNRGRKDADYKNSLISDYISIHSGHFINFQYENSYRKIAEALSECIRYITCDRKVAAYLTESLRSYRNTEDKFTRGAMAIIPLTKNAVEGVEPQENQWEHSLYSYRYCSLIQYRYLLDLQSLFLPGVQKELQRVQEEMARWEKFRNQPIIVKYESLADKIYSIVNQIYQRPYGPPFSLCYWSESEVVSKNEDEYTLVRMDALNVQTDRRLNRSDSMVVWEELNEKYPCLQPARQNRFEREDLRYDIGYCIAFRMKNIAKSSLRDIVNYEESNVVCANNPDLSKLLLSRQGFFATKAPQEWLHVLQLHAQSAVVEELRGFIWKLATWSKVYIFSYELPRAALQKVVGILAVLLEHSHVDTLQSKEVQETSCVLVSA